jgi:sugar O-acyltransferase (sialic acid O-acetyltransferase NeuD family)
MYPLLIVGAGGFGREVHKWATDALVPGGAEIKGFLDDDPRALDGYPDMPPVLGSTGRYSPASGEQLILAVGDVRARRHLAESLSALGGVFKTLIHPTAVVSPTARIGRGAIICPFAVVSDAAVLHDFVIMNCFSMCAHDAVAGSYAVLSPYAAVNGFSVLEEDVFLGTHATVAPAKRVGRGSKVSAGAAVMYDLPPGSLAVGVPAQSRVVGPSS